jgi:hypothetical protein
MSSAARGISPGCAVLFSFALLTENKALKGFGMKR